MTDYDYDIISKWIYLQRFKNIFVIDMDRMNSEFVVRHTLDDSGYAEGNSLFRSASIAAVLAFCKGWLLSRDMQKIENIRSLL